MRKNKAPLPLLFSALFRERWNSLQCVVAREPARSFGLGAGSVIAALVLGIALCVTLIGIPAGLLVFVAIPVAAYVGLAVAASITLAVGAGLWVGAGFGGDGGRVLAAVAVLATDDHMNDRTMSITTSDPNACP